MKCKRIRRKLVAYLDEELTGKRKLLVGQHLTKCPECKKEADLLENSFYLAREQERLMPSEDFETKLWQRIRSSEKKELVPQALFGWLSRFFLPAAVVAALTIGVVVGSSVEKIMPSEVASLQEEQYLISIGLGNFEDLPAGSLPEIYFNLGSTGEGENT